MQSKKEKISGL